MQVESNDHSGKIGRRRKQAARERAVAFKVASAAGVLGLAILVGSLAVGWTNAAFSSSSVAKATPVVSLSAPHTAVAAAPAPAPADSAVITTPKPKPKPKPAEPKHRASSAKQSGTSSKHSATPTRSAVAKAPVAKKTHAAKKVAKQPAAKARAKSTPKLAAATAPAPSARGTITIETFGYSFGPAPPGSRFHADVRNIKAGNFPPTVTGLMASVRARVMKSPAAKRWLTTMKTAWEPRLKDGDMVAIGCSRGHHRSVTLAVLFAKDLRAHGWKIKMVHRDIHKTW